MPGLDVLMLYAPAPAVVLTLRPSRRKTTLAIWVPFTDAVTVRPAQPEGPVSLDAPAFTVSGSTPPSAGGWTAGGCGAGGCGAGGCGAGGWSAGGWSAGGVSGVSGVSSSQ